MRLLGLRAEAGRRRRRGRAYAGVLEAAIGLIDVSSGPRCPLGRRGRIEMTAALLQVAAADRALRAAFDSPSSPRRLEAAVRALDEARSALEEARCTIEPRSAAPPVPGGALVCSRCGCESLPAARGWRAYLLADEGLGICCPVCAAGGGRA